LDNALINPGFELWDDNGPSGPPDGWTLATTGFTAVQDEMIVFDGMYSVALTWTSTTTQHFTQYAPIVAGQTYDLRLRYFDADPNGRVRLYCYWRDVNGTMIGSAITSEYSSDLGDWQIYDIRGLTAPSTAVTFEYTVRMYDEPGWIGSAMVVIDSADLCGPPPPTPTFTPEPTATFTEVPSATPSPLPTETFTPGPTPTTGACEHHGDVNGDGGITPGDAQMTFQLYLSCYSMAPTMEQYCAADFCGSGIIAPCDGSVTPSDAQGIMRDYLGYASPCMKRDASAGTRKLTLIQSPGRAPGMVLVRVGISGTGAPISAFGIALRCGSAGAQLLSGAAGELNPNWTLFKCVAAEPGVIRIAGLTVSESIGADRQGTLAELRFTLPLTDASSSTLLFDLIAAEDDLAGVTLE